MSVDPEDDNGNRASDDKLFADDSFLLGEVYAAQYLSLLISFHFN